MQSKTLNIPEPFTGKRYKIILAFEKDYYKNIQQLILIVHY
jgi:hypothetical protein